MFEVGQLCIYLIEDYIMKDFQELKTPIEEIKKINVDLKDDKLTLKQFNQLRDKKNQSKQELMNKVSKYWNKFRDFLADYPELFTEQTRLALGNKFVYPDSVIINNNREDGAIAVRLKKNEGEGFHVPSGVWLITEEFIEDLPSYIIQRKERMLQHKIDTCKNLIQCYEKYIQQMQFDLKKKQVELEEYLNQQSKEVSYV